jgi:hypothetical protein
LPEGSPNFAPVDSSGPKAVFASRVGRRGLARSSEDSQHSRPPAASQDLRTEVLPPCVDCLGSYQRPRLPGFISGSPLQPMNAPPEGFCAHVRTSVCIRPTGSLARSKPNSAGADVHFEISPFALRLGSSFRRSSS